MAYFPTLSSGQVAQYPATRINGSATRVIAFADDSEQRYRVRAPLASFVLAFTRLSAADLATLRTFFDSMKGRFDSTFSLTFDGEDYDYMTLEQDAFAYSERGEGRFDVTLSMRQTRKNDG